MIARGNDRQDIFHSHEDRLRFLGLLAKQKARSPFFLYAYCLMTNHIHLLLERQQDTVGNLMKRILGGYSRYYNRKPADYDGDGKADPAIYRDGEWWTLFKNGYTMTNWGLPTDLPIPRR